MLGLGALEYSVLAPATVVAAAVVFARGLPISGSLTLPWIIGVPVGAALALAPRSPCDPDCRAAGSGAPLWRTVCARSTS